ncbi:hypothetical protein [Gottfriedia acidiceleris]|uniref:Uncharacterized protein n=1 Tax=Gottfriedia acidiceleris TaxID=371036 RepID=A0ABY4JIZ6_9BACI|nr:hypothetical protein [Gottfriedia acidiceleris]UPM53821.1 hypothetical protein MY490_18895 [Gottfriedia acidiceleris]
MNFKQPISIKEIGQAKEKYFEKNINRLIKEVVTTIEMKMALEELKVKRIIRFNGLENDEVIKQVQNDLNKILEDAIKDIQLKMNEIEIYLNSLEEIKGNSITMESDLNK